MPFDANLVLVDGTVDLKEATDTPAVSTTRLEATGAAVIDLKETGVKGLAAVLVLPDATVIGAGDTLTATLEASDVEAFTAGAVGAIQELGKFAIAAATIGIILAAETPAIVVLRFSTNKRYVRANLNLTASTDNFGKVQVLLSPYPFNIL